MTLLSLNPIKISSTGEHLPIDAPEWDAVYIPELGRMYSAEDVPGGEMDDAQADAACAALTLGGFNDWRQPDDRRELDLLVDLSKRRATIDGRFFRNTKSDWYRTKHAVAGSSGLVWIVNLDDGDVYGSYRDNRCFVRAVRSVAPAGQ